MESNTREKLIEKVKPFFKKDDYYEIKSGLDFLFSPSNVNTKPPAKWKQFLITWSAIYPLSMLIPLMTIPVLGSMKTDENHYVNSLIATGIIVFLMV